MSGLTWEQRVLRHYLYEGDRDGGGARVLSDRIVTARKATLCWLCNDPIQPGTRIRVETAVLDGSVKSARTCFLCCDAMARSWDDDGEAIEARYAMGFNARRAAEEEGHE